MKPVPAEVLDAYRELTGPLKLIRVNFNAVYRALEKPLVLRVTDSVQSHRDLRTAVDDLVSVGAPILAPLNPEPIVYGEFSADLYPMCQPMPVTRSGDWADLTRRLHSTPVPDSLGPGGMTADLDRLSALVPDSLPDEYRPVLDERLSEARWIMSGMPTGNSVVHGDSYLGNVMLHEGEPVYIDPDSLHRGYALEDLAWAEVGLRRIHHDDGTAWGEYLSVYDPEDILHLPDLIRVRETVTLTWMAGRWDDIPALREEFHHRLITMEDPYSPWLDF